MLLKIPMPGIRIPVKFLGEPHLRQMLLRRSQENYKELLHHLPQKFERVLLALKFRIRLLRRITRMLLVLMPVHFRKGLSQPNN